MVNRTVAAIPDERTEVDVMEAVKDVLPCARIRFLERADQLLHLLPLRIERTVGRALRETAGTAEKFKIIVPRPGNNCLLYTSDAADE